MVSRRPEEYELEGFRGLNMPVLRAEKGQILRMIWSPTLKLLPQYTQRFLLAETMLSVE
jgi:hypothetical protein